MEVVRRRGRRDSSPGALRLHTTGSTDRSKLGLRRSCLGPAARFRDLPTAVSTGLFSMNLPDRSTSCRSAYAPLVEHSHTMRAQVTCFVGRGGLGTFPGDDCTAPSLVPLQLFTIVTAAPLGARNGL